MGEDDEDVVLPDPCLIRTAASTGARVTGAEPVRDEDATVEGELGEVGEVGIAGSRRIVEGSGSCWSVGADEADGDGSRS